MSISQFPLPLDNTFEIVNDVYAQARKAGHIDQSVLRAWYEGAMVYETDMPCISAPTSESTQAERDAFFDGSIGRVIPGLVDFTIAATARYRGEEIS